jgi:hypothetical protein
VPREIKGPAWPPTVRVDFAARLSRDERARWWWPCALSRRDTRRREFQSQSQSQREPTLNLACRPHATEGPGQGDTGRRGAPASDQLSFPDKEEVRGSSPRRPTHANPQVSAVTRGHARLPWSVCPYSGSGGVRFWEPILVAGSRWPEHRGGRSSEPIAAGARRDVAERSRGIAFRSARRAGMICLQTPRMPGTPWPIRWDRSRLGMPAFSIQVRWPCRKPCGVSLARMWRRPPVRTRRRGSTGQRDEVRFRRVFRELTPAQPLPADVTVTAAALGGVQPLDRTTVNSWQDIEFLEAVHATGRRKLILCACGPKSAWPSPRSTRCAAATTRPPCWRHWRHEGDQKPRRSLTMIAVTRPGVIALLMTRMLFTPLDTP